MEQEEQKRRPRRTSMVIPLGQHRGPRGRRIGGPAQAGPASCGRTACGRRRRATTSKAQDYFNEALRYIEIYKSYAVKGVYTVRLIPDRRDCLWRIAEYHDIYGDPYLWPKIWRRNRKLIQNPDLIYPGWQLVIPPE